MTQKWATKETYLRSTNQRRAQTVIAELPSSRASILALNFELQLLLQVTTLLNDIMESQPGRFRIWTHLPAEGNDTINHIDCRNYSWSRGHRQRGFIQPRIDCNPHVTTWDPKYILAVVRELFRASIATKSLSRFELSNLRVIHLLDEVLDCRGTVHTTVGNFWQKRAEWYKCLHKVFVFWNVVIWGIVIL